MYYIKYSTMVMLLKFYELTILRINFTDLR